MRHVCDPLRELPTLEFAISALDQRKLPHQSSWIDLTMPQDYIDAIHHMVVRGAPLIGFTAIYACANWFSHKSNVVHADFLQFATRLKNARPTAINLAFEVDKIWDLVKNYAPNGKAMAQATWTHAKNEIDKLALKNLSMAKFVKDDLCNMYQGEKLSVLTICNTGRLACGTIGTALGVIEHLHNEKLLSNVYACETRPYLQGSRLTAFELKTMGIDFNLIVEGAVRQLMSTTKIHAIFAGADRIAANGDTANKVGTAVLAEIAQRFSVPFYIVAPLSSFDIQIKTGESIPIELREDKEITELFGQPISPLGCKTYNPSFDVTPSSLITGGIACEAGLFKNNFTENIKSAFYRR
jgi:methylthioribose-1-phosphate isomerase